MRWSTVLLGFRDAGGMRRAPLIGAGSLQLWPWQTVWEARPSLAIPRTKTARAASSPYADRTADDGMDVSAVAKSYGGGGHMRAAGFRVPYGHELTK